MRVLIGIITVFFALAGQVMADAVQEGYEAFQRKDWTAAHRLWLPEAESGDVRAQFYLSVLYAEGMGVSPSPDLSTAWLKRAAEGGFPPAQFNLGNLQQQGDWVEKNDAQSAYWWSLAAKSGFSKAQYNLASLYSLGRGVEQDLDKAIYWYRKAAQGGSEKAKNTLATLGLPFDETTAFEVGSADAGQIIEATSTKLAANQNYLKTNNNINNELKSESNVIDKNNSRSTDDGILPVRQDFRWIQMQPDDNFTVQIFASDKSESAGEIVENLKIVALVAVCRYARVGKEWFAVIVGSYATLEDAKSAVETFPEAIRNDKPWIKKFRIIKAAMDPQG